VDPVIAVTCISPLINPLDANGNIANCIPVAKHPGLAINLALLISSRFSSVTRIQIHSLLFLT
jgi:hypothetical protein